MSRAVTLRLPEEILEEVELLAKNLDRSKTYLIKQAIEIYLEEYADYQIALDRLNDKDDEILTGKELRACFGD
jgi:Predicted DNA-binding protein with an HTH domain